MKIPFLIDMETFMYHNLCILSYKFEGKMKSCRNEVTTVRGFHQGGQWWPLNSIFPFFSSLHRHIGLEDFLGSHLASFEGFNARSKGLKICKTHQTSIPKHKIEIGCESTSKSYNLLTNFGTWLQNNTLLTLIKNPFDSHAQVSKVSKPVISHLNQTYNSQML